MLLRSRGAKKSVTSLRGCRIVAVVNPTWVVGGRGAIYGPEDMGWRGGGAEVGGYGVLALWLREFCSRGM